MLSRANPEVIKSDFLQNTQQSKAKFQKIQSHLTSGNKVLLPSDSPAATINYMEWENRQSDITKFNSIIGAYQDKLNIVDSTLDAVTSSLQRVREVLVQASNGVLKEEDRVYIAMEVDQHLRQMVSDANAQYNGVAIFGGTSTNQQPYRIIEENHEEAVSPFVSKVQYFGNAQEQVMDIGRYDRMAVLSAGSNIFQTTQTVIEGNRDVSGYVAPMDCEIALEGISIHILAGDSLEAIAQRINDAQSTCTASVITNREGESHFRITSISARQPWIQDISNGVILKDLGLINTGIEAPHNYSTEAIVQKSSLFDTLVTIKRHLLDNDVRNLGGEDLGYIDQSLSNIMRHRSYTGALVERLQKTFERNMQEEVYLKDSASRAVHTDYVESITQLKMAEFAHQTALNIGSKLLPITLMDFLR